MNGKTIIIIIESYFAALQNEELTVQLAHALAARHKLI